MVIITRKQTNDRKKDDFYPTPLPLAEAIVQNFVSARFKTFFDAGAGAGVFGQALRNVLPASQVKWIDGADTVDRNGAAYYDHFYNKDFTALNLAYHYDCLIGNPPYNLAEAFVRHGYEYLKTGGSIIFLLKLAFLESQTRGRGLFKELTPDEVHVLVSRPSFDGTGHTNDYAFAVFIWSKPLAENKPYTRLSWLDWR